jgi:prepilin-type N-terminal cleavage/methylation domain-containing protein
MNIRKAFTLIELLVVIAIIALLLSIIVPALRKAKDQARKVICASNLSQLGKALEMYEQASNYRRLAIRSTAADTNLYWMGKLADYAGDSSFAQQYQLGKKVDLLLCPSAPYEKFTSDPDLVNASGQYGSSQMPWEWKRVADLSAIGSYTLNGWVAYDSLYDSASGYNEYMLRDWLNMSSSVPLFGDGIWTVGWPKGVDNPPLSTRASRASELPGNSDNMRRFCIDRHQMKVNLIMRDLRIETVALKDLWYMRWHKNYQPPVTEPRLPNQ